MYAYPEYLRPKFFNAHYIMPIIIIIIVTGSRQQPDII